MVDEDALARMLQQLQGELSGAESELIRLQNRVGWLRQAVSGIKGLLGQTAPESTVKPAAIETPAPPGPVQVSSVPASDRPKGAEAVRRVLAETAGRGWTVQEMTAELERRGWTPDSKSPADAVRTAMVRAWRASEGKVQRQGSRFVYQPQGSPSPNGHGAPKGEVNDDQEMSPAALTLTGDSQQPDMSAEQS